MCTQDKYLKLVTLSNVHGTPISLAYQAMYMYTNVLQRDVAGYSYMYHSHHAQN